MNTLDPKVFSEDIRECWAVHQTFRSLGFSPDDIYIGIGKDLNYPRAASCLFVILRAQGKEFSTTVGAYLKERDADDALEKWSNFVNLANSGMFDQEKLDNVFKSSGVFANSVEFIFALHEKGINPMRQWS